VLLQAKQAPLEPLLRQAMPGRSQAVSEPHDMSWAATSRATRQAPDSQPGRAGAAVIQQVATSGRCTSMVNLGGWCYSVSRRPTLSWSQNVCR
jgi:hypothetical protein